MRAPDYLEPTIGWRSWLVVDDRGEPRLRSLGRAHVWAPRCELVASCMLDRHHHAPVEQCTCGIYAARELGLAAGYMTSFFRGGCRQRVIGRVSLWGSVVECDEGWRASHAYSERIYVPAGDTDGEVLPEASDLTSALSVYGVPIHLIDNDLSGQSLRLQGGSLTEASDYVTLLPLVSWVREAASCDPCGEAA